MHAISTIYYPISIDEIRQKIFKKNGKRNHQQKQLHLFNFNENEEPNNVKKIINDFGERITRVDGEIPINLPISNGDRFLFISYDQSKFTHGFHKYPAKFFPELPRWLIKRYSNKGDTVLDPFSGSGTTNVEALLLRRHSLGVDVDPFSRFLSKVKTTPLDESELKYSEKTLLRLIDKYHPSKVSENDIPSFPYRDNWFNKEIVLELAYIKKVINSLDVSDDVKDFFKICFSSVIRSVSNADDNCTRTVIRKKLNKKVYPADALKKFVERILVNIPKMIEFSKVYPNNIKVNFHNDSDARSIKYRNESFDLAITSPPYANAVDYPRTHQLEIYWLEFANGSLTPLKKIHVGTESVSSEDYRTLRMSGLGNADYVISKIFHKDPRRAFIAYKYLKDMELNLKEVYRVLRKGGRYVVVVGNNKIRNELFETWKYLMEMSEKIGFSVECYFGSEIIRHFIKVPREERITLVA